jgi:hypothetical protein
MTKLSDRNARNLSKSKSGLTPEAVRLSYEGTYICPICRHGEIANLALMDAFACNFCRHIFTANLAEQTVQVVDSSQPMSWRWNGQQWKAAYRDDLNLTVMIWFIFAALVVFPSLIVWLPSQIFTPLPGSRWAWFPLVWTGCTFVVHALLAGWLIAEHYQIPFYIAGKIWLRDRLGHR